MDKPKNFLDEHSSTLGNAAPIPRPLSMEVNFDNFLEKQCDRHDLAGGCIKSIASKFGVVDLVKNIVFKVSLLASWPCPGP